MRFSGVTRKLFLLTAALAAVSLTVVAGLSWQLRESSLRAQRSNEEAGKRTDSLLALIGRATQAQSAVQKIVRERDPDKLEAILAERDRVVLECRTIVDKSGLDTGPLGKSVTAMFAAGDKAKDAAMVGDYAAAQMELLENASPAFEAVLGAITDAEDVHGKAGTASSAAQLAKDQQMGMGVTVGAFVSILLLVGVAIVILHRIQQELMASVGELDESASQMASASNQVSDSSQALASGASEQAASLEQSSASSEELKAMTEQNAVNARAVTGLMAETAGVVGEANKKLGQMVVSMKSIEESSGKVGRIIKVIDEIAFQTNILALNAAVEAARAGTLGQGFAVVADEVRSLAQRSAQAANDTTSLIQESIASSRDGSLRLREVAQVIERVTKQAEQARLLAEEVNTGSEQQAQGIKQLATTLNQMQSITQQTAASAEESASAAEESSAQSESMRGIVQRLGALVGIAAE
jgi:methyl-accepting chemotaxis protein